MITDAFIRPTCPICEPDRRNPAGTRELGTLSGYPLRGCPDCDVEWLERQPDDQTLANIYNQEYYDAWGIQLDEDVTRKLKWATFARILGPIRRHFEESPRLLDCGAATGFLMEVARSLGMEAYGIELSQFGAGRIVDSFGAERVFCGPFDEASFEEIESDFFDVITMIDFLEHVRDPLATLSTPVACCAREDNWSSSRRMRHPRRVGSWACAGCTSRSNICTTSVPAA